MRRVYLVVTVLLLIAVVAQFYFAAFGVFGSTGDNDESIFAGHRVIGTNIIPLLSIIAFIVALVARAGGKTVGLSILPLGLVLVQILLFIIAGAATGTSPENPTVPGAVILGLHAVNGLAILGTAITLVTRARALVKSGPPERRARTDAAPVATA